MLLCIDILCIYRCFILIPQKHVSVIVINLCFCPCQRELILLIEVKWRLTVIIQSNIYPPPVTHLFLNIQAAPCKRTMKGIVIPQSDGFIIHWLNPSHMQLTNMTLSSHRQHFIQYNDILSHMLHMFNHTP